MKLASLFQNGAILQRNTTIPVWGNTTANSTVGGTINGISTYSRSSASGDFTLYFPPLQAGGPYTLEICCNEEKIVLDDILIGEVWLASGQSNMRYQLGDDLRPEKIDPEKQLSRQQESAFFEAFITSFQVSLIPLRCPRHSSIISISFLTFAHTSLLDIYSYTFSNSAAIGYLKLSVARNSSIILWVFVILI